MHIRSARPDAVPMILTHGWPGSVVEFLDVIEPLTAPADPDAPAFHLVIPSLPGFGFSGPTRTTGWNRFRTTRAWVELMHRLGYDRYVAAGNDAGSMIAPEIGRIDPDGVIGVHVTQVFSFPSGDPAEFATFGPADYAALQKLQWFYENMFSFNTLHSQQPQTLAFALADSPVGLLAWNAQLMGESLDPRVRDRQRRDLLADRDCGIGDPVLLRGCAHRREAGRSRPRHRWRSRCSPETSSRSGRWLIAITRTVVRWTSYDTGLPAGGPRDAGGHYAAHEATDVWVGDVREFVSSL